MIRFLTEMDTANQIIAGVRNIDKTKQLFSRYPGIGFVAFDFEKPETFDNALKNVDLVFLLRPPHISEVEKYFRPLIKKLREQNINEVVFLSVQGAEKSKVIPHNKIERLIHEYGLEYIFLRPSYFMQNLTTTLIGDIKEKRKIILPSGKAKFNWIDVKNIGESSAILIERFSDFKNLSIELTGYENENFFKVVELINDVVDNPIRFQNVSPFRFYRIKKRSGMTRGMIMVMLLLHFLPRFQKEPRVSQFYEKLTGKKPTRLKEFIEREKTKFEE